MVRRLIKPLPYPPRISEGEELLDTPKYLLDVRQWKVFEYDSLAKGLPQGRRFPYGVISYTWGKWLDENRSAEGKPEGIRWNVPYINGLPLELARDVLDTWRVKYVWWDWMCVPQHSKSNPLTDAEKELAGQEIAKQRSVMPGPKRCLFKCCSLLFSLFLSSRTSSHIRPHRGIYQGAIEEESYVWLHRMEWYKSPLLATFLCGSLHPLDGASPRDTMSVMDYLLKVMQQDEPWLTSGWTLQEGILLPNTKLVDQHGIALDSLSTRDGYIIVSDISNNINPLAVRIAKAFIDQSERKPLVPEERIGQFIAESRENYDFTAKFLGKLLRSGLVGYGRSAPLFILTGRVTRRFSRDEDRCWAVLGAVEIKVKTPTYFNGKQPDRAFMDKVYSQFFYPLLAKYQWELLLLPRLLHDERGWEHKKWERRIGEGHALPLEVYFQIRWLEKLPLLTLLDYGPNKQYNHLLMEPSGSKRIIFLDRDQQVYCRRYVQDKFEDGFVSIESVAQSRSEHSLFLRIGAIEPLELPEFGGRIRRGYRCIEIRRHTNSEGHFLGVADVWSTREGDNYDELFRYMDVPSYKLL
jgi:hypothetical protein